MNPHRIFCALAAAILVSQFSLASSASAQAKPISVTVPQRCEVAYSDIEVSLSSPTAQIAAGKDMTVRVALINKGKSPVVDVSIIARVERADTREVVDRFVAAEGIQLSGNSRMPLSFAWRVPAALVSGSYKIGVYAVSAGQFAVSGAEWSDGSVNASLGFGITGGASASTYLDAKALRVEGSRLFPNRFIVASGSSTKGTIDMVNGFASPRSASISWKVYSSEALSERSLVANKTEKIDLAPGRSQYAFAIPTASDPLSHVVIELNDGAKKSIYSFRVLKKGASNPTLTSLGLSIFPVKAGDKVEAFGCVASSVAAKSGSSATLRLSIVHTDGGKSVANLGSSPIKGLFSEFSRKFVSPINLKAPITLKAELLDASGAVISTASLPYSCDKLECRDVLAMELFNQLNSKMYYAALVIGVLGLLCVRYLIKKRKEGVITPQ